MEGYKKYSPFWSIGDHLKLDPTFPGSDKITENYSQAWQDIWVLQMLNGKRNGTYLEIGANDPKIHNNTYLLSTAFGWSGVSIEYDPSHADGWKDTRPNDQFLCADALKLNYSKIIETVANYENGCPVIDYLQLDIDPSLKTLEVLNSLPLDLVRFSTITFETDAYRGDLTARTVSRKVLESFGYILIGGDILVNYPPASKLPIAFEDWWVDSRHLLKLETQAIKVGRQCFPQELIFSC